MYLNDSQDGILNTSTTWAKFEFNLRSAFDANAKLGRGTRVIDIGDGNGHITCCGFISCDWVGAAAVEKLPREVVIKIPSILPFRKLNDSLPAGQKLIDSEAKWAAMERQLIKFHNTEVATYNFLQQFQGLAIPKMYYAKATENGVSGQICLEYMNNTRTMNLYEKHSVEQVNQVARALGKIQACSLKKEPRESELQKDYFKMKVFSSETLRRRFKSFFVIDNSMKTLEFANRIDAFVLKYHGATLPTTIHRDMGFRPVLVNGDMHTGNVLIDKNTGNLRALIDWQCTHLGVGVEDLHKIAMSSLTAEERRSSMSVLTKIMYDSLVENLDVDEPPYTLEQHLLISDLIFPHCALLFASQSIPLLGKMDKYPHLTVGERASRKEVVRDKILGTLEDALLFDIKNEEHINNLKMHKHSHL